MLLELLKILTYWGKRGSVFLGSKRILKDIGLLALGIFKENFEACQSYLFFFPPDLIYFIKKYFCYTRITSRKILFMESILSLSPPPHSHLKRVTDNTAMYDGRWIFPPRLILLQNLICTSGVIEATLDRVFPPRDNRRVTQAAEAAAPSGSGWPQFGTASAYKCNYLSTMRLH